VLRDCGFGIADFGFVLVKAIPSQGLNRDQIFPDLKSD
jgi:hypothetical protein